VHVSLLPPLADARLVELPPLEDEEALAVLRRDAARHFLGAAGPRVVGLHRPGGTREGQRLAAAAELSLLEAVREAVERCGWSLESVGAAHGAWIAAAHEVDPSGEVAAVAVHGRSAVVMRLRAGSVESVRHADAADPASVLEAMGPGPGRLLLLAPGGVRDELAGAASRAGWVEAGSRAAGALELAAERAADVELELVPPTLVARRAERSKRRALRLGTAAAALVALAAGAHLWGAHRELGAVRAERLAIADRVGPLLQERDSLQRLTDRVNAMSEVVRATPRWTPVLAELASLLPTDSHLTGLFTSGDTLELEAAGSRAGEAIQRLRASRTFADVRLEGVVERELENGETVVERFRVSARLADAPSEAETMEDAP
jgi:hypothetical protein